MTGFSGLSLCAVLLVNVALTDAAPDGPTSPIGFADLGRAGAVSQLVVTSRTDADPTGGRCVVQARRESDGSIDLGVRVETSPPGSAGAITAGARFATSEYPIALRTSGGVTYADGHLVIHEGDRTIDITVDRWLLRATHISIVDRGAAPPGAVRATFALTCDALLV